MLMAYASGHPCRFESGADDTRELNSRSHYHSLQVTPAARYPIAVRESVGGETDFPSIIDHLDGLVRARSQSPFPEQPSGSLHFEMHTLPTYAQHSPVLYAATLGPVHWIGATSG